MHEPKSTGPVCVFCGSDGPMSREHIWADCLRKALPSDEPYEHKTRRRRPGKPAERRAYPKKPYRIKAPGFCERCNNTWMSEIDNAVKPWALPLIQGRGKALHETGQRLLSQWAILKTLAFDQFNRPSNRTIAQRFYDAFYAARGTDEIPACFEVFAAQYGGSVVTGFVHAQAVEFKPRDKPHASSPLARRDAYTATLGIDHLVLKVFGRDPEGVYEFIHGKALRPAICRLWPFEGSLIFPPGPPLNENGLAADAGDELL